MLCVFPIVSRTISPCLNWDLYSKSPYLDHTDLRQKPYCSVAFYWIFSTTDIHYHWKHYKERLRRNFYVFLFNWKENKEVGTICFKLGIPKKKTKIHLEKVSNFYVDSIILFGSNQNYFWKRVYSFNDGNYNFFSSDLESTLFPWPSSFLLPCF